MPKRQETEDGFELQFGTNFLGAFRAHAVIDDGAHAGTVPKSNHRFERRGQHGTEEDQLRRSAMGTIVWTLDRILSIEAGRSDVRAGAGTGAAQPRAFL